MTEVKLIRSLLLLLAQASLLLSQDPDPAIKQACTQYKQTVFEEKIGVSFFIANAPVTYETIDSCYATKPFIVDGTPADPKEFPHSARLGQRKSDNTTVWFCGGTLISNRLVLTAAHCLYSPNGAVNVVRLGELDFATDQDDAEPEDFGVLSKVEHPDYNYKLFYNDIAILRLDREVEFSAYKHPACLPFDNSPRHDTFIAIGWGHKKFAGKESTALLKVKLKDFGNNCTKHADFEELPRGFDAKSQLCIGSKDNKDTCNGDSGGPVLIYHEEYPCMYHVMGITSFGISCDTPNVPSYYTRVHYYLDWIKQEMAKKDAK